MLVATVLIMGGATVAIGLLPSYAAVGIWASAQQRGGARLHRPLGARAAVAVAVADVAAPDGHGGIRLMGRAADRVGGVLMIPASDVESELLKNPGAEDVALTGYPGENDEELACAVIVRPPSRRSPSTSCAS